MHAEEPKFHGDGGIRNEVVI